MKSQKFHEFNNEEENQDKQLKLEEKHEFNKLLDDLGFSRYHMIIFVLTSLVLICGGVQELMLAIVLSLINKKDNLSEYHLAFVNTMEYLGYTTATILVNIVIQYLSNRRSIQIFSLLTLVFTGLSLFSLNYYIAAANRFFTGLCLGVIDLLIYLHLFENLPTRMRGFVSSIILLFFPLGQFIISVVCYFNLNEEDDDFNYRNLLLIPFITIACSIVCLIFLQESPRRLAGEEKYTEGIEIVKKISKINKDDNYLDNKTKGFEHILKRIEMDELKNKTKTQSFLAQSNNEDFKRTDIRSKTQKEKQINLSSSGGENTTQNHLTSGTIKRNIKKLLGPNYKRYTLVFWIISAFTGFVFNAIFFMLPTTAPQLNKDTFRGVILSEGLELPSNFLASILIENKRLGRLIVIRVAYACALIVTITCLIIGNNYLIINCLLKFFVTIPVNVLLVYSSEIYDSKVRTLGVSIVNFWRRLACIIAPFLISYLESNYGSLSTYYLFCPFIFFSLILSMFINTETRGIPLDEMNLMNSK